MAVNYEYERLLGDPIVPTSSRWISLNLQEQRKAKMNLTVAHIRPGIDTDTFRMQLRSVTGRNKAS
jgi:hypothetical protein